MAVVKQHSYNYELAAMYTIVLGDIAFNTLPPISSPIVRHLPGYFTAAGGGALSVDEQVTFTHVPKPKLDAEPVLK